MTLFFHIVFASGIDIKMKSGLQNEMERLPFVTIFGSVYVQLKLFSPKCFVGLQNENAQVWCFLCGKIFG